MKCLYINLERAQDRRSALEASFAAVPHSGWELVRFAAVDAQAASLPAGAITDFEKACFLSHRGAIQAALGDEEHLLVVEDDVAFSPRCFEMLEHVAKQYGDDWDILYAECLLANFDLVIRLLKAWPERVRAGQFQRVDLSNVRYAAAAAYLVNGRSKARLAELLRDGERLDQPYDLVLRRFTHERKIRSYAVFPFLVSLTGAADTSQIQPGGVAASDFVMNALRRLMVVNRDEAACRHAAQYIVDQLTDENARLSGAVLAGLISSKFPNRR